MKKAALLISFLLMLALCMFAPGCVIDDSPSPMRSIGAGQVDLLVFLCGETYLTHEKGNLDWLETYGDVPAEISLNDGEFAYVNADIARITGGSSFYTENPEFKKINSFHQVSFEDLVNNGELKTYDPAKKDVRGVEYYVSDTAVYCITRVNGTFYVYENGVRTGEYHTKDEMVSGLGLS